MLSSVASCLSAGGLKLYEVLRESLTYDAISLQHLAASLYLKKRHLTAITPILATVLRNILGSLWRLAHGRATPFGSGETGTGTLITSVPGELSPLPNQL